MGNKRIRITTGDPAAGARHFAEAWRAAEAGTSDSAPAELLVFENLETLLRTLTPARWALLKALKGIGPQSVRALSKFLRRDYKNVHTDVGVLERVGLIERDSEGKVVVPWDTVVTELSLAA